MDFNKESLLAFNLFCSWIIRYENDYPNVNNHNFGAFKRHHGDSYAYLIKIFGNQITVENMLEFIMKAFSKIKSTDDINIHSGIILDQILSKKFSIGGKDLSSFNNDMIQPLTELKQKILDKYNSSSISEVTFPRDSTHSDITIGILSTAPNTQIVEATQASDDPILLTDTQLANLMDQNRNHDDEDNGSANGTDNNNNIIKELTKSVLTLVEENRKLSEKIKIIDNKVSHSNLDQNKSLEDFEYLYLKSIRYRNHNNLFRNHYGSVPKNYPPCLDVKRFPVCLFKHDSNLKDKFDAIIKNCQSDLLNLYIEYTREKIDIFDVEVRTIGSQIKLTNPNGEKILRDSINKVEKLANEEAKKSDSKFKRNFEKTNTNNNTNKTSTPTKSTLKSNSRSSSLSKSQNKTSQFDKNKNQLKHNVNARNNNSYSKNKSQPKTINQNNNSSNSTDDNNNKTYKQRNNNSNKNIHYVVNSDNNRNHKSHAVNFHRAKQTKIKS